MISPAPTTVESTAPSLGGAAIETSLARHSALSAWPSHETLSLDGVVYKIEVELIAGHFHAGWECLKCHEISGSNFRRSSIDDAISFAKNHLMGHHHSTHRAGSQ